MAKDSTDLKQALFAVSDGVLGCAVLIFIGVWGGNWLDAKFQTAPWFSITLSLVGGGLGLARLIQKATKIGATEPVPKNDKPDDKSESLN